MRTSRKLEVAVISFLIFTLSSSPLILGKSRFNLAFAADEQSFEPEGAPAAPAINDPHERFNRGVFEFNDRLYFYALKPTAVLYSVLLPKGFREAIQRGFHNVVFPCRWINLTLQGKSDKAADETLRFLINSTLGLAGLFDFAQTQFGLENHDADFGQTLALWGVGPGDFLMLPILGPSDPRDLFGYGVDTLMDPLFWLPVDWWITFSAQSGKFINNASLRIGQYEELKQASLDPYIGMRDAYIQYREHLVTK